METMMILYKSLIASYLNYGLLLWGNVSHKVLTLQKKAIRPILFLYFSYKPIIYTT